METPLFPIITERVEVHEDPDVPGRLHISCADPVALRKIIDTLGDLDFVDLNEVTITPGKFRA